VTACVLDTDVVIAALDRRDAHHAAAAQALTDMIATATPLLLSLVNYAEALVRPAEDDRTLRTATGAIAGLGIRLVPPTPATARDAARWRAHGVSLADGFAMATAAQHEAALASFDRRVQRALPLVGLELAAGLAG